MEIVLVILAILVLGKTSDLMNRWESRVIAGSILGITYFFIWPYFYYYLQLISWSEQYTHISFVALIAVAMLTVRVLLTFKTPEITQILMIILFLFTWGISSVFDIELKDLLAERTGFFKAQDAFTYNKLNIPTKKIDSPRSTYTLRVPERWIEKKHPITHLPYYETGNATSSILEFRPRCYSKKKLSMTDIVIGALTNHRENESSHHQCFKWRGIGYACKVEILTNAGETRRVRWLAANRDIKRILELDFITEDISTKDSMIIDSIFESVKFKPLPENIESCVYSIDWF